MSRHPLLESIRPLDWTVGSVTSDLEYVRAMVAAFQNQDVDRAPTSLTPDRALPEGELEALRCVGMRPGPMTQQRAARARRESMYVFFDLFSTALTVADVAAMLSVTKSRIRQRLRSRTLLALSDGRERRLPVLQFHENRELPGLSSILPGFPRGTSTIEALAWLVTPNVDLASAEVGDAPGEPISPRNYLLRTNDIANVAKLTSSLRAD